MLSHGQFWPVVPVTRRKNDIHSFIHSFIRVVVAGNGSVAILGQTSVSSEAVISL